MELDADMQLDTPVVDSHKEHSVADSIVANQSLENMNAAN
jgi:hypothetical protein